jgi:Cytochrome c3
MDCHASISASQETTAMRRAATDVAGCGILQKDPLLTYRDGPYTIRIQRSGAGAVYSVTDGRASVSAPIRWAFGLGSAGQTYILEQRGIFYESRVSYYTENGQLDLTIGHAREPRPSLPEELGRAIPEAELTKCFSCHTSEDIVNGRLLLGSVHPGVTCENCHGPGNDHVVAMEYSDQSNARGSILNPGKLAPSDINDFCGRCHRSTRDVLALNIRDVRNVRFQPYRLENSRCYDPTDKRITCLACHDPHKQLETASEKYDAQCHACHAVRGRVRRASQSAPACQTATANCVSCHMPKTELPGSHYAFTDHYIRVTHAGERYPE